MRDRTRLTTKQFNFCCQYYQTGDIATAALAAGYSPHTAYSIGRENLQKPLIVAKIEELRKKTDQAAIMGREERVAVLSEIGRADVTQFVDSQGNIDISGLGAGVISEVVVSDWRANRGMQSSSRNKKVKLYDKLQAIDILNKMEKVYSEGPTVNIDNRKVEILVSGEPVKALLGEVIKGVAPHTEEENV